MIRSSSHIIYFKMENFSRSFRKVLVIAWFIFCFIVIIMSLVLYFTVDESKFAKHYVEKHKPITFKTISHNGEVTFNATWVSDDEILTQDDSGNIILFDINHSKIKSVLAFNSMQHVKKCSKYELSADRKYLLIGYNDDRTVDGSSSANYDIITVKTGKQVTLRDTLHKPRFILSAKWSPADSSLVIVDNYNIFYISTAAKPNHAKQITFQGSEELYHGVPDWVYREEIFHSNSAMWFSTKGTQLAYARFNETLVPSTQLLQYGIPDTMYDQHSHTFSYRYPKVKDANPTVELFVQILNISSKPVPVLIKPTKQYPNETILYDVVWSDDENLFVMWMNRIQNESHLVHYHLVDNAVKIESVVEFEQENGWLNFQGSMLLGPEHQVALIYPTEQENGDFYRHVCLIIDGVPRPLTAGYYEVTKLLKWDFENNKIYLLSSEKGHPEKQHMYVLFEEKSNYFKMKCLTCDSGCDFSSVELSKEYNYFAHTCTGPDVPYVSILKSNGDIFLMWDSNRKLQQLLEDVALPRIKFITVPLNDDYEARVKLIIPPTATDSSGNKFPLLIHTGGPLVKLVSSEFKMDINVYLCVNHNFVVAEVDGRGTGGRGSRTLFANYKKIGTNEIDDQIAIVKYLKKKLPFLSKSKTGIWGWGYGGYMAGMVLARDKENVFDCALSVAPITDWIYHDSVFTERLMGTYTQNFESYRNASLIEHADGLRHKKYMVIHGLSDTKVHFQHSAMLSKELQHQDIVFKQQFYPDQSHKLQNVKKHLYRMIVSFMLKYLG